MSRLCGIQSHLLVCGVCVICDWLHSENSVVGLRTGCSSVTEWTSIISMCTSLYPFSLYLFVFSAVINNRLIRYFNRLKFCFCFCLVIWLAFCIAFLGWLKSFILIQVFVKVVWKQFTPLVVAIKSNNFLIQGTPSNSRLCTGIV